MKNQEKGKRNDTSLGQKIKEAWGNKSIRALFIAFVGLVGFTILKLVLKF